MAAIAEAGAESLAELGPELDALEGEAYRYGKTAGRMTADAARRARQQIAALASKAYTMWKRVEPAASAAAVAKVGYDAVHGEIPWDKDPNRSMLFVQAAHKAVPHLRNFITRSLAANESVEIQRWGLAMNAAVGKAEMAADAHVGVSKNESWISAEAAAKARMIEESSALFGSKGSVGAVNRLRLLMDTLDTCGPADCDQYLAIYRR